MAAKAKTERGNWLYIGPSIPTLGLQKNTIYRIPDCPPALKLIAARKPVVLSLFVHVADLAEAKRRIEIHGSLEHSANQEMLSLAKTTPR